MRSDGEVVLVKSDSLGDWYVIERAEHEHRGWMEAVDDGEYSHLAYRWSGRISDADVEGTAAEMTAIAEAIESGQSVSFRRCAASAQEDGSYHLESPRNSQRAGIISADHARRLALSIREVLARSQEPTR